MSRASVPAYAPVVAQVCLPLALVLGLVLGGDQVKDVDKHTDVAKHLAALRLHVAVHVRLLPTAVPQIEHEVAQEAHMRVLHLDRAPEALGVLGPIRGKNERAHRGLAGPRLAHQQHLPVSARCARSSLRTLRFIVSLDKSTRPVRGVRKSHLGPTRSVCCGEINAHWRCVEVCSCTQACTGRKGGLHRT